MRKALDLKSIWLFSGCTASELRRIRSSLDEVQVPKGKVLVEEGRIGLEFFLIVDGTAVVTRNGRKVATVGPGDYFGELALLDRRPRSASVVSETEMDLLVLSQRQFNGLLESVPTISPQDAGGHGQPAARRRRQGLRLSRQPAGGSTAVVIVSAGSGPPGSHRRGVRPFGDEVRIDSSRSWETSTTRTSSSLALARTASSSMIMQ